MSKTDIKSMSDDEITVAMLMGTQFTPERFELVPSCPWVESLRRRTGLKDLFVYHHVKTKKFGLAQWLLKPRVYGQGMAIATEICLFSDVPGAAPTDLPTHEWLMWRCKPEHEMVDEMRKNRLLKISAHQTGLLDRKTALDDMEKVLRKRGLDEAADKLSLEDVPEDGPELDEMRELLTWAMNGKVISTS